jgi:hypothetical protein
VISALPERLLAHSEQLNPAQLELLMQLPESSAVAVVPPQKERSPSARKDRVARLPENLPVVEEVIDPEPVKAQPEQWRCIGQEVSARTRPLVSTVTGTV